MIKILFVCHGNICRSPMAEFVLKDMVQKTGRADEFEIASAATSREELGEAVYPPVRRLLKQHGINCSGKRARQITADDYAYYDCIVGMDEANLHNMLRFWGGDDENKICLLLDFTPQPRQVADPWYSGDFEQTWRDVNEGCRALLSRL